MADLTKAAPQELTATLEEVVRRRPTSTRRSWASNAPPPRPREGTRSNGGQG